jgi:MerC mercury resistance protein
MIYDPIFHDEHARIKKIALLFTIPCAILPIMMATAGIMSLPFDPMLFQFDFLLYGLVYALYIYGLLLSWKSHRKFQPAMIFIIHLVSLTYYLINDQEEWSGYCSAFSIIATSVVNQYFRIGNGECVECSDILSPDNKLLKDIDVP